MNRYLPTDTSRESLSAILATLRGCNDADTPPMTAQIGVFAASGRVSIFRSSLYNDVSNQPTASETKRVDAALRAAGFEVRA